MAECIITKLDVANYVNDKVTIRYNLLINKNSYSLIFDAKSKWNMSDENRHILTAWLWNGQWQFDENTILTEELVSRAIRQATYPKNDFYERLDYFILNFYRNGGREYREKKINKERDYLFAFAQDGEELSRILTAAFENKWVEATFTPMIPNENGEQTYKLKAAGIKHAEELIKNSRIHLLSKNNMPLRDKRIYMVYMEEDKAWADRLQKNLGNQRGATIHQHAGGISTKDSSFLSNFKSGVQSVDFVIFIKSAKADETRVWGDALGYVANYEEMERQNHPFYYVLFTDDSPYEDYQNLSFKEGRMIDIRIKERFDFLFMDIYKHLKDINRLGEPINIENAGNDGLDSEKFNWPVIQLSTGQFHWLNHVYDNFVLGKLIDEKEEPLHWRKFGEEKSPTQMHTLLLSNRSIGLLGIWHIDKRSKYFELFDRAIFAIQNYFIEKGAIERLTSQELSSILSIENHTDLWCIKELIINSGFTNGSGYSNVDVTFNIDFNGYAREKFRLYKGIEKYIQDECIRIGDTGFQEKMGIIELPDQKINEIPFLNSSKIAGINNDGDTGTDHLEITKDVTAFAKIIASKSFVPPLAIALFGDWGTGKSFFMNKLKDRIKTLSSGSANESYCKGIVQIHFNAWSYLDANLWASIVTQIFEKLSNYINDDSATDIVKAEIEKKLATDLSISKEQQEYLKKQKQENEEKLRKLNITKRMLSAELEVKFKEIREVTFNDFVKKVDAEFKVNDKINEALKGNESLLKTKEELKKIIPKEYWNNPAALYNEAQSKGTFIKEFFSKERVVINLAWILGIIAVVMVVPVILDITTNWAKSINFTIIQVVISGFTIAIPTLKRFQETYKKLQPLIATFWNIKNDYEQKMEDAVFDFKQKEKVLKLEIEQKEKELEFIELNIQEAEKTINIIEFKINNTLSTEALYSFIDRRSNSDDYKKHLGIVSYIRKDFEILSHLFIEHSVENKILAFRDKLKKPLERIVLYIDDLDRCSEEQVVQVLEAVNLLMAFPLFVVVVGVDPRWVKNALVNKYRLQFTGRHLDSDNVSEFVKIDASNYLEKIFQVPFHLKKPSDENIKTMIQHLSTPVSRNKNNNNSNSFVPSDNTDRNKESFSASNNEPDIIIAGDTKTIIIEAQSYNEAEKNTQEEYLELSEKEIALMQNISDIIGTNPRAVKRFVNVYKIIKAHEELTYNTEKEDKELLIFMFLLALPIGPYQKITSHIYYFFETQQPYKTLSAFIEENKTGYNGEIQVLYDNEVELINKLKKIIVENDKLKLLLEFNPVECNKHLQFIKRFTFADLI